MNLELFCRQFQTLMDRKPANHSLFTEGRSLVEELVREVDWFREVLEKLVLDQQYLEGQRASIWPNELTLYRSPDWSFIVLSYFWKPGETDIIHDHGAWGIISQLINSALERKFRRLDDGRREGYAELEQTSSHVIESGNSTIVLPLDEGIHQMANITDNMSVSVNVYGKVVRKGYVQFYNPETNSVRRIYKPQTLKGILAIQTLGMLDCPWAKDILLTALQRPIPDFLKEECKKAVSEKTKNENQDKGSQGEVSI